MHVLIYRLDENYSIIKLMKLDRKPKEKMIGIITCSLNLSHELYIYIYIYIYMSMQNFESAVVFSNFG